VGEKKKYLTAQGEGGKLEIEGIEKLWTKREKEREKTSKKGGPPKNASRMPLLHRVPISHNTVL
jgi:hypothetical protein